MTTIRRGTKADDAAAVAVLRQSVSKLCSSDHQDDDAVIADWLSNKTATAWASWISRQDAAVLVAERADDIIGIGMVDAQGEILLNYVHPDMRFKGVSKTILGALEDRARAWGCETCFLESTRTAKRFYEACGYQAMADSPLCLTRRL